MSVYLGLVQFLVLWLIFLCPGCRVFRDSLHLLTFMETWSLQSVLEVACWRPSPSMTLPVPDSVDTGLKEVVLH